MSTHLSELCAGGGVEPIIERLKQLCPARLALEAEEVEDGVAAGFTREAHDRMHQTFGGVWGYQDDDGRTALHWAVAMRNFSLASMLLSAPYCALACSEDHDGASPFITACMVGAPEAFLTELLTAAAEQRWWKLAERRAAVGAEAEAESTDGVEELVAEHTKAVVNQPDIHGNTPLLHSAGRGNIAMVRFLLNLGASIDQQNKRGQSALHRSTGRGATDVVEELVSASKRTHKPVEHRRWMNLQDYRGETALFYASMDNNEELGRYLLRHGADRAIRNKEGKEFWEV
ncbi:26S proteasome non-ATPase regulatory subunit 10 [Trypanosoma grayi]|uniref:26S proteasome non-ATPase regulatory subunit 10 n=1 Tax=Trypanosoma grayi TaxID=71804 RepID=UPI0004F433A0|nr:26S proteasome non-ATPase regulatory subunit 10 [Trypanosoma grayi]KEG15155.1 26S proteasome non-ATPase regulatory subunit 10 [Trypanosoma grayi]